MSRVRATACVLVIVSMAGCSTSDEAPITERDTTDTTEMSQSAGDVAQLGFSRPWIDPGICEPTRAWEGASAGLDLRMFSQSSHHPFTIQAVATSDRGPAGPFAVILRYADRPASMDGRQTVEINGIATAVTDLVTGEGNAEAIWMMPDGGMGYLRSRGGLDVATITDLVAGLVPRSLDAAVPGFDYRPETPSAPHLQLMAEHVSAGLVERGAGIACTSPATHDTYLAIALTGEPALLYARVIDRIDPLDVALIDDTLVIVSGPPASPLFTAAQLTEADPAEWQALLSVTPDSGPIVEVQM